MWPSLVAMRVGARYVTRCGWSAIVLREYVVPAIGEMMYVGLVVLPNGRPRKVQWVDGGYYRICGHDLDLVREVTT